MSGERDDDLLIAVALTQFSVQFENADLELSEHAWQLAADRLIEYDVEPCTAIEELQIGDH